MAVVSYAQNMEDIMLWRALKHVEKGFYIDVGAYSPDKDSVTKLFYEKGWSGVNIEPNSECHTELVQKRPRDKNFCFALSNKSGQAEINILSFAESQVSTGLSTLDRNLATKHIAAGYLVKTDLVESLTLVNLIEKYITTTQEIHFLKIDVEGLEKEVIEGNNWQRYQPWIVLVESISPADYEENHLDWEYLLTSAGYHFVYADQINRFYISPKHPELRAAFRYPPNLFDGFVIYNHIDTLLQQNQQSSARLKKMEVDINTLLISRSWKITQPLRTLSRLLHSFFHRLKEIFLPLTDSKLGGNKCKS
ncbi:MAG: FkbM family methyltransferase [Candidatus Aquirickettsiella gammari]|jgi:FkbM family methyltransferase